MAENIVSKINPAKAMTTIKITINIRTEVSLEEPHHRRSEAVPVVQQWKENTKKK